MKTADHATDTLSDTVVKLETNVDDSTGEMLGYLMERLLSAKAKDVFYTPVFMKKNRPAYMISVLCDPDDVEEIQKILFTETTTIGIRSQVMDRTILKRQLFTAETSFGPVAVKKCRIDGESTRIYPEYESIRRICEKTNAGFPDVFRRVFAEINK